jgi:hypothetical protein
LKDKKQDSFRRPIQQKAQWPIISARYLAETKEPKEINLPDSILKEGNSKAIKPILNNNAKNAVYR